MRRLVRGVSLICETSGVLIGDCPKESFMTVSSHSFPKCDSAFHSHPQDPTDAALTRLEIEVSFANRTFQYQQEPMAIKHVGISPAALEFVDYEYTIY